MKDRNRMAILKISSHELDTYQLMELARRLAPPNAKRVVLLPLARTLFDGAAVQLLFLDGAESFMELIN